MGRFSSNSSYGHRVRSLNSSFGEYEIAWTVDFYYPGNRLRYPRRFRRVTSERNALRFAKKHGLPWPPPS